MIGILYPTYISPSDAYDTKFKVTMWYNNSVIIGTIIFTYYNWVNITISTYNLIVISYYRY